jgi:hypothetical protein
MRMALHIVVAHSGRVSLLVTNLRMTTMVHEPDMVTGTTWGGKCSYVFLFNLIPIDHEIT